MADLDARAAASAARPLGEVRPVLRAFRTGRLSPRCAQSRSPRARCGPFRARYGRGSDRAARPGFHEVEKERSEEHTSELQSLAYLVCRLLLEKKKKQHLQPPYRA